MELNPQAVTFGVEIECYIPRDRMDGWSIAGYHSSYGGNIPESDGWRAMEDGSLCSAPRGFRGVEIVSPVLRGREGLASVRAMVARLNSMGAVVNKTCGLHVHVGIHPDYDLPFLRRLVCLCANNEQALFAITGDATREQQHFCAGIKRVK